MITVGLLWHSFSSDNLGVGALSVSQILLLEKIAARNGIEVTYKIVGTRGDKHYLPTEIHSKTETLRFSPANLINPRISFLKLFSNCDFVIDIGEGDSFTDIYGFVRFFKLALSKFIVLISGTPLIHAPQTIGPFESPLARMVANILLRKSTKVFTRDGLSTEYLRNHSLTKDVTEASDVAFMLPFRRGILENENGRINIGLNVSGLLFNGGYTGKNQFGLMSNYQDTIAELVDTLHATDAYNIYLVPHVISDTFQSEDDYRTNIEIQKARPFLKLAPKFSCPAEAKSFISGLDLLIGSRMHATIAAISSGVPSLPIAYSRKFAGLLSSIGYTCNAEAKNLTTTEIKAVMLATLDNLDALQREAEKARDCALSKLQSYEDELEKQLMKFGKPLN